MAFIFNNLDSFNLWIISGFILILAEFIIFPGLGILFLGLGALTNAILTSKYDISLQYQLFSFGLFSCLWFVLLWWPLNHYVYKKNLANDYQDIVGNEAEVLSQNLSSTALGQIKWSGTILNAKLQSLSNDENQIAIKGEIVLIKKIEGNIAICIRKPQYK